MVWLELKPPPKVMVLVVEKIRFDHNRARSAAHYGYHGVRSMLVSHPHISGCHLAAVVDAHAAVRDPSAVASRLAVGYGHPVCGSCDYC